MDTTKQNIKMCEKASEIQTQIDHPSFKDWRFGTQFFQNNIFNFRLRNPHDKGSCYTVWLPRQDQLQGMVGKEYHYKTHIIADLYRFWSGKNNKGIFYLSMEQLWLAFVMKEKYNKVWNGMEWEDESN